MRAIVLAFTICGLAGAAQAQADGPRPWSGVWQGTLGGAEVRACFGTVGQSDLGSYYYLRHLKLIPLQPGEAGAGQGWSEGDSENKDAPRWTLSRTAGGALTGTWSGKGRSLPIRLTRMRLTKAAEAEAPCGGMTFMGPRLVQPTVTRKPAVLDGAGYTRLIADVGAHLSVTIESFELPGTTPAAARLNTQLAKPLPKPGARGVPDWLDCLLNAAGAFGVDGEFEDVLKPDLITRRWLVTQEANNGECGGAHPSSVIDWRVYTLTSGETVDPWTWFTPDAVTRRKVDTVLLTEIGPKLRKILIARWPGEDECKDVAGTQDDWDVHPTREGLAFWPQLPHVSYPCSQDVVVPYRELAPLLNEKGRAAIAEIIEDLRSLPPRPKAKS